ncbi:MAG TPA: DUF2959 family protein [Bryobacteraceae bacterium]|nr:DUF2959 family protein [Bryobacteraceae bacterium]
MLNRAALAVLATSLLGGVACGRLYYASMEKLGKEKRDILVKRIVDGKKDQEEAREQIKTTLESFKELTGFDGGNLEKVYNELNSDYEAAKSRADDVTNRIKSIEQVSQDLFNEWAKEIDEMGDASLKSRSRAMLRDAQSRQKQYMTAMHATERKMQPVIRAFHDQVLFLKHNLNARAIKSLKTTLIKMDKEVEVLVADIDRSMKESDAFVQTLLAAETS